MLLHQVGMSFPGSGGAYRLRLEAGTVDERIDAIRGWFREQGRDEFLWWIGKSATPGDLEARLRARGATPWEDRLIVAMLTTEPPPPVEGIEVRKVETYEDFLAGRRLAWDAADFTEEQCREALATQPEKWAARVQADDGAAFLAIVDDQPVASGDMVFLPFAGFLSGASTKPDYRGRGAFRALVRARWDEAVRRGTPALIVGAGHMSRPILERLGFRTVSENRLLLDRSGLST